MVFESVDNSDRPESSELTSIIIGGAGFLGRELQRQLCQADGNVTVLDNQSLVTAGELNGNVNYIQQDITDRDSFKKLSMRADIIFHLAAEHRDDVRPVSRYDEVNIQGTKNVCDWATQNTINTIVFTSSVAVYGLNNRDVDESVTPEPFNDYGRTKLAAEQVLREWQAVDPARRVIIVRPTVIFGPNNRGNVYNLIRQVIEGPFMMIGRGDNCKSMAYVNNVAAFLVERARVLGEDQNNIEIFNYADQPDFSMNELVAVIRKQSKLSSGMMLRLPYWLGLSMGWLCDVVARLLGRSLPISAIRIKKFTSDSTFSAEKAFSTGFQPACDLKDGLINTIQSEFPEK